MICHIQKSISALMGRSRDKGIPTYDFPILPIQIFLKWAYFSELNKIANDFWCAVAHPTRFSTSFFCMFFFELQRKFSIKNTFHMRKKLRRIFQK